MAKISIKELAVKYEEDGSGDFINEEVDGIFTFRKINRDEQSGYSIVGGGDFRQNDAAMVVVTMMDLINPELKDVPNPEDNAEFALLRMMFDDFSKEYIKNVLALRKEVERRVKENKKEEPEEPEEIEIKEGEGRDA